MESDRPLGVLDSRCRIMQFPNLFQYLILHLQQQFAKVLELARTITFSNINGSFSCRRPPRRQLLERRMEFMDVPSVHHHCTLAFF
jgi:hypothetical protein